MPSAILLRAGFAVRGRRDRRDLRLLERVQRIEERPRLQPVRQMRVDQGAHPAADGRLRLGADVHLAEPPKVDGRKQAQQLHRLLAERKHLPVARAVWRPRPNLRTSAESWLIAGAPHHTVLTAGIGVEELTDLSEMLGVELLVIDNDTTPRRFAAEMRWNQAYYRLAQGF